MKRYLVSTIAVLACATSAALGAWVYEGKWGMPGTEETGVRISNGASRAARYEILPRFG